MSRAGLVSLILLFLSVGLTISAPVPERVFSLTARFDDYDNDFVERSLAVLVDREFDIVDAREYLDIFDRGFDVGDDEYSFERDMSLLDGREFDERDAPDVQMLYRRRSIFSKIKSAFKKIGSKIKSGFKKMGSGIKKGFQKVGSGLKKAGRVLKKGFQKVGKFIKKTAAKVAKVYLKVVSAVASVAAKVVKFIPGVGTGLSMAIKGVAYGANVASDKIHANLGKFGKFTNGLNYVINPMGSAAKAAGKHGGKAGSVVSSLMF